MINFNELEFDLKNITAKLRVNKSRSTAIEATLIGNENCTGECFDINGVNSKTYYYDSIKGKSLLSNIKSIYGIDAEHLTRSKCLQYVEKTNTVTIFPTLRLLKELEGFLPEGILYITIKFLLDTQQICIKYCMLVQSFNEDIHPVLPDGSWIGGWAYYKDYPGYDFPQQLNNKMDIFYTNPSHKVVNNFYDGALPEHIDSGFYGIQYNRETMEVVKAKAYDYDQSSFSDWWGDIRRGEENPINSNLIQDTMRFARAI